MHGVQRTWAGGAGVCLALAAASTAISAAPGYDPWSWLLWGRELASLELHTAEGPAFKPLPVAITALLSVTGDAAPTLWMIVARAGALAAVALAFVAAAGLAGGERGGIGAAARARRAGGAADRVGAVDSSWRSEAHPQAPAGAVPGSAIPVAAGAAAALGVLLTDRFVAHAASGESEPLLVALALGAFLRARAGAHGQALALGLAAALVRTEAWPLLALYGLWCWREVPRLRPALALAAVAVPAAWFVPEWLSSGELLRSADRARIPNPGAPALAEHPALESGRRALGLLFVPTAAGLLALRSRAAAVPALAGTVWIALVALMAEAGFSGEERYALPGAALIAVSGAIGLGRLIASSPRAAAGRARASVRLAARGLALVVLAAFTAAGAIRIAGLAPGLAAGNRLAADLPRAIAASGGREAVLRCGRPAVGRLRGPLLAYHLRVPKRIVRADGKPDAVTFRSRRAAEPVTPPADPQARTVTATRRWQVQSRCAAAAGAGPGEPSLRTRTASPWARP